MDPQGEHQSMLRASLRVNLWRQIEEKTAKEEESWRTGVNRWQEPELQGWGGWTFFDDATDLQDGMQREVGLPKG
jgi:hypothetical protein